MKTKMRKSLAPLMASALVLGFAGTAYAQDSNTGAAVSETEKSTIDNPVMKDGEGLDAEITNARMRADSGSRSKISMSTSFAYNGGSLKDPLSEDRPNLDGDPATETQSDLNGSISARYRFNKNTSATLGAGVGVLQPFHGADQMNIDNPAVGLSRVYKWGPFQTASSLSYTHGTSEAWTADNVQLDSIVGVSQNMMAQIGDSGFTAGASLGLSVYNYGNDELATDGRTQLNVGLYPQLEYQFTDKLSARTVFGYFNFYSKRDEDALDFQRRFEYQSVGVGISVTRDIYLYPNVQFIPDNLSVDNTNVAISATVNLF